MKKIRILSASEKNLWAHVAKSIKPARRGSIRAEMSMAELMAESQNSKFQAPKLQDLELSNEATTEPARLDTKAFLSMPSKTVRKPSPGYPPVYPPLAPIERNLRRKLSKGKADVDGKLDLHGLTQDEAYNTLVAFIHRAVLHHKSLILIVTGKGGRKLGQSSLYQTGILRRMVPIWLSDPTLRNLVIGFEEAAIGHGGAGALYVRLRRSR